MMDWLPQNVSTFGGDIDSILYLIYYIIGAWFVLLHVLIFWFLFRYRHRKGHRATYVTGNSLRQAAWILIPDLIVLSIDLYIDIRGSHVWATVKQSNPEPDLVVGVTGKQFNWEMTHPGPDAHLGTEDDLMIENDLHVPVDSVVQAILTSKDVTHSLFLPELRLKQDTLPGREIRVWFEVTKPGRYEIACAELCGFDHSGMKGYLYVHTPEEYEEWMQENWPPS